MRHLLIGRFQPFHRGHAEAVRTLVAVGRDEDPRFRLLLGIGSAADSHTLKNPFTAGERWRMIEAALDEMEIRDAVDVVPIPDLNRNALWVRHVESLVPPFTIFYSNNALPATLFREAGYEVRPIPLVDRARLEGTAIRARIAQDDGWEADVPKAVAAVVRGVDGPGRLAALQRDDRRPG